MRTSGWWPAASEPDVIGLFYRVLGLFCRVLGLFCRILGLCVLIHRPLLTRTHTSTPSASSIRARPLYLSTAAQTGLFYHIIGLFWHLQMHPYLSAAGQQHQGEATLPVNRCPNRPCPHSGHSSFSQLPGTGGHRSVSSWVFPETFASPSAACGEGGRVLGHDVSA